MTFTSPVQLTDRELIEATSQAVQEECRTTAQLLALLAELDSRRLYLAQGFSSLFTYCTQALHLSEPAAYSRITAARASRTFPILLDRLADGAITLTTITLLAPHLTAENHEPLLDAAKHKTKREVEQLVACLYPQPDIPPLVRRLAVQNTPVTRPAASAPSATPAPTSSPPPARDPRPEPAPIASDRYLLRITVDAMTQANLQRARDLLRHRVPNGDPAAVIGLALAAFVEQLEKKKAATTTRPRSTERRPTTKRTRHIPAVVRREVWQRDEARCAFVGPRGRCMETGFLEFHHLRPFADGGMSETHNLQLRCRAHNQHEAEVYFGGAVGSQK